MGEELRGMRGRFHKTFRTEDPSERRTIVGASPIHFRTPSGEWEDLANLVQQTENGWVASTDETTAGVVGGWLTFEYQGRSLRMRPTAIGMVDRTAPASRWRKLADADYSDVVRDGPNITVTNIFPQTDLELTIGEGFVSKAFTVRQRPSLPDPVSLGWDPSRTYVVIVWDVEKPAGAVVKDAETGEVVASGYVGQNSLRIETPQGDVVSYLDKGEAVSASGRKGPVWFVSLGASVPFGEALSYQRFMNAPYPIVIDPTTRVGTPGTNMGYIQDDLGTKIAYSGNVDAIAGNNYTPGGGGKPPDPAGGGEMRGFMRFDLTSITGTCTDAKLRGAQAILDVNGGRTATFKCVPDWGTLDSNDWATATNGSDWGTTVYAQSSSSTTRYFDVVVADPTGGMMAVTRWIDQEPSQPRYFYYSSNGGSTWTLKGNIGSQYNQVGVLKYVNGYWFFGCGAYLYRSNDNGQNWTNVYTAGAAYLYDIIYNGTIYMVSKVSDSSGTANLVKSTTSDSSSWSDASYTGTASEYTKIAWDGTYWWSSCGAVMKRTSNADGTNWQSVTPPTNATRIYGLACGESKTIIACDVSAAHKVYSYDNGSWVDEFTATETSQHMYYLNGKFVIQAFHHVVVSDDGDSWSEITYSFPFALPPGYPFGSRISYDNGTWYLAASDYSLGPMRYFRSTDDLATLLDTNGTAFSLNTSAVQGYFGSKLHMRVETNATTTTAIDTYVGRHNLSGTFETGVYLEVTTSEGAPLWVSPADGASTDDTTPTFTFTSTSKASAAHFNMQLDTANTFNTGSLRNLRSVTDQSGWEYWDGSAWQSLPATGIPSAKTGNDVRYTPSSPMSLGTWYRRVRQG